ncbi:MAG: FKBP-type peptidyl-prolyl cis-trans isomerase N-terminal domain-containing protein [Roseibacillus sp.]
MKKKFLLLLPLFLAAVSLSAQEPTAPAEPAAETDPAVIKTNSSYGFGFNNGNSFKQQMSRFGLTVEDIDRDEFIKGFMDALDGKEPASGQEALNAAMLGLRNQVQEREKVLAEENLKAAEEFLAKNKEREGVITTESGLQYEILKAGEGEKHDGSEGAKFMVNYKGTLIDGSEFDASPEGSPVPLNLNRMAGIREALTSMPVGSKWKLFIKPDLAYGQTRRSEKLAPNSTLIFEIELAEIQKAPPRPKAVSPPIQIPPAPKSE